LQRILAGECAARKLLNNDARSAIQSEKPQIVWCGANDSSRRYNRVLQRARCRFSGETLVGLHLPGLRLVRAR